MAVVPSSSHASGLGNVVLSGTPSAGQVVDATAATTAAWAYPPGYIFNSVESSTSGTISATTSGTANTIITAGAVTFDGATVIYVDYFCPYHAAGTSGQLNVGLFLDGTLIYTMGILQYPGTGASALNLRSSQQTPASGSRTYSVRAWRSSSNWTYDGTSGSGLAPVMIRLVKA